MGSKINFYVMIYESNDISKTSNVVFICIQTYLITLLIFIKCLNNIFESKLVYVTYLIRSTGLDSMRFFLNASLIFDFLNPKIHHVKAFIFKLHDDRNLKSKIHHSLHKENTKISYSKLDITKLIQ